MTHMYLGCVQQGSEETKKAIRNEVASNTARAALITTRRKNT